MRTAVRGPASRDQKRLLMVAYNYPPIGGYASVRTTNIARYVQGFGWRPTVLTVAGDTTKWGVGHESDGMIEGVEVLRAPFPDVLTPLKGLALRAGLVKPAGPGGGTVITEDASTLKARCLRAAGRLVRWGKRWASFPDRYNLWLPFAFAAGLRELKAGGYDAIYSSSPPVTCHCVASCLQRATGLPWLADYRDPWSQNPSPGYTPLQQGLNRRLELKVMRNADALVTVSGPLARMLEELHGERPGGVSCVTNGYDPEDYPGSVPLIRDRFVMTYTGMFYGYKRDPSAFLAAVTELIDEGLVRPDEILIRLYGPEDPVNERARAALKHPQMLEIHGPVPRAEAVSRQRESAALLILMWDVPYNSIIYGGKVFEYMGSRRPILAWNPRGGILGELLEGTGAGVSVPDAASMKAQLLKWVEEFRRTGELAFRGDAEEIARYGWDRHAGEIAAVLDGIAR